MRVWGQAPPPRFFDAPAAFPFGGPPSEQNSPVAIVTGDFNSDGNLDAAVAAKNTLYVMLGDGHGGFRQAPQVVLSHVTQSIAAADFNGDGHLDLAVTSGTHGLTILLGNGDGTFQAGFTYKSDFTAITLGDFNRDGKVDLAMIDSGVAIMLGNGDGTFAAPVDFAVGASPHAITCADFNHDGKLDLAVSTGYFDASPAGISILLGRGDGTFQTPIVQSFHRHVTRSIASGDFNADGIPDLAAIVVPKTGSAEVFVLRGNGDGTFAAPVRVEGGRQPEDLVVADLNADGYPDVAVLGDKSLTVLLGHGNGSFRSTSYTGGGSALAIANFEGGAALDAAMTDGNSMVLSRGSSQGTFQQVETSTSRFGNDSDAGRPVVGDFNGDGKLDLVLAENGPTVLMLGNGDGAFQPPAQIVTTNCSLAAAAADFNGDGKLDVAVACNGVSIMLGNGDGTFQPSLSYAWTNSNCFAVNAADVNLDGKPDLIASCGYVYVLLGNGDGTFQAPVPYPLVGAGSVVLADFNGDGNPDITMGGSNGAFSILFGNGDGSFQSPITYNVVNPPVVDQLVFLATADFNGDGKPDLAAAAGNSIYILVNTGSGFALGGSYALIAPVSTSPAIPSPLIGADLNADGKPDVAVVQYPFTFVAVLLGNGDGSMLTPQYYDVGAGPFAIAAGDFSASGKTDLAITTPAAVAVMLNTTP